MSLPDGLTTLDGIQLQLTPTNLVCPNVQISGIDPSNINNITLQVTRLDRGAGPHLGGRRGEGSMRIMLHSQNRADRRWVVLFYLDKKGKKKWTAHSWQNTLFYLVLPATLSSALKVSAFEQREKFASLCLEPVRTFMIYCSAASV